MIRYAALKNKPHVLQVLTGLSPNDLVVQRDLARSLIAFCWLNRRRSSAKPQLGHR